MSSSKDVSTGLKKTAFSFLKGQGFTEFTTRSAWRVKDRTVHVVNIQSFSQSVAYGVGCTTYSFAINLGISVLDKESISDKLPQEWECEFRKQLHKGVAQAGLFTPYGEKSTIDRPEIWYVLKDGSNISEMLADATRQLELAMKWFDETAE